MTMAAPSPSGRREQTAKARVVGPCRRRRRRGTSEASRVGTAGRAAATPSPSSRRGRPQIGRATAGGGASSRVAGPEKGARAEDGRGAAEAGTPTESGAAEIMASRRRSVIAEGADHLTPEGPLSHLRARMAAGRSGATTCRGPWPLRGVSSEPTGAGRSSSERPGTVAPMLPPFVTPSQRERARRPPGATPPRAPATVAPFRIPSWKTPWAPSTGLPRPGPGFP